MNSASSTSKNSHQILTSHAALIADEMSVLSANDQEI